MSRKLTVKNVVNFAQAHDVQVLYSVQQFLEWFGVGRKLERIIWSMLKKVELDNKRIATERQEPRPKEERTEAADAIQELPPMKVVIGLCPKCTSPLYGEPLPYCESKTTNRVFYKECGGCTYYVEVIKRRNSYLEIEGGETNGNE